MKQFGLIGYPLAHSFSAQYFSEKFFRENIHDCRYELFPIQNISEIKFLIENNISLKGLNITIPYKESIIPFLTSLDNTAKEIGAVNTIRIIDNKNFILHGYNTDAYGFEESIKPLLKKDHQKALILGTGGASRAVAYVLKKLGIEFLFISRNKNGTNSILQYNELNREIILTHQLIINTTPLGMFPNINEMPDIPYDFITKDHLLFDLVYNPSETLFMKKGIKKNAVVANGLQMLYLQAERSWQIWND
jgi:shikimate dehydrogenase